MAAKVNVNKLTKLGKVLNAFIVRDNIQTLSELADKTNTSQSHLHQLMYKTKNPTKQTVEKLLYPFDMSPKDRNSILSEFDFQEGEKFARKAPPKSRAKVVGTTERYNPKPSPEKELLNKLLAIPEVQVIYQQQIAKERNERIIKDVMEYADKTSLEIPDEELIEFYEQLSLYAMEEAELLRKNI